MQTAPNLGSRLLTDRGDRLRDTEILTTELTFAPIERPRENYGGDAAPTACTKQVDHSNGSPASVETSAVRARHASSLALLCCEGSPDLALLNRLWRMGHQLFMFAGTADFLVALDRGERFGLLLLPMRAESPKVSTVLSIVCKALGMPVLLLTQAGRSGDSPLRNGDFAWSDAVDLCASRTTDEELDWRIREMLRQTRMSAASQVTSVASSPGLVFGDYQFFDDTHAVLYRGRNVVLQPRQFHFALQLFQNFGRLLTREWLWQSIWKLAPQNNGARTIDVCAANVRRKLELHEEHGLSLRAVYGQGYLLSWARPRAPYRSGSQPNPC